MQDVGHGVVEVYVGSVVGQAQGLEIEETTIQAGAAQTSGRHFRGGTERVIVGQTTLSGTDAAVVDKVERLRWVGKIVAI